MGDLSDVAGLGVAPLVKQWAWGEMHPKQVNHIARLMKQDLATKNLNTELLDVLAELGTGGTNPNLCLRDLGRRLPVNPMPPLRRQPIAIDHPVLGKSRPDFFFIDPHEFFSVLYHNYPKAFFRFLVPSMADLEGFWDAVSGVYGICLRIGCLCTSLALSP